MNEEGTTSASVLLSVAYDGRDFHGFAPQPGQRTVAGELLGAIRAIDPRVPDVRGASRTDAGVHAKDQRVAFDPSRDFPLTAWSKGLRRHLPESLAIRAAWHVPHGYSPRVHAIAKTYRYLLLCDENPDPLLIGRVFRVPELAADPTAVIERMQAEATSLVGTHDFAAFRDALDARLTTTRTLKRFEVSRSLDDPRIVRIDVTGDGFLYHMVRILVGTLVDVARSRLPAGAAKRALESKDRRAAGVTAPPDGLYLERYELDGV
ncbi:MAG: tRNA pseudouridine(38-40) synthase TruA [Polyangiaceae bacterium]